MKTAQTAVLLPVSLFCALAAVAGPASAQVRPNAVMLRYPDVSAEEIVFRYAGDLWIVDKRGGEARRVTTAEGNESFPKFSPDGKTVAFVGGYDGGSDVYTLSLEAGAPFRVTHHPTQELLSDWTPDGEALVYWSTEVADLTRASKVMRVGADGGQPEALPVPYGTFGSIDASGTWLAYTPYSREFRTWKRYRGGRTPDVWLFNLETREARNVTGHEANDQLPMWHGSDVVFLSDRTGVFNLYAYDTDGGGTRALTDFDEFDVKFPSMGPDDVVFENGGKLFRHELASGRNVEVEVTIPGERPDLRPQSHEVADLAQAVVPGPSGVRIALEARGDVYTIPVESGVTRNLTRSSGAAERDPAWSPDGKWIAYFSDRSGEYELCIRRSDGKGFEGADERGEKRLTSLGQGWKSTPVFAPDSQKIVYTTNAGAIHLYDLETDELTEVGRAPTGFPPDPEWSADSAWLTWSHRHSESRLDAIYLYEVASGERHEVTSGLFDDSNPTFDRNGDWLYFESSRTFLPIYADLDTTWIYTNSRNLCAVPLRADVENPWAPENQEEEIAADEDADEDEAEEAEGDEEEADPPAEADEPDATGEDATDEPDATGEEDDEEPEPMTIEIEGFESRVMLLPVEPGRFGGLEGAEGKLVYLRSPRTGTSGGETQLCFFDTAAKKKEDRKEKVVLENCQGFDLTAKGDKVLVLRRGDAAVVELAEGQEFEAIAKDGLVATIDPREEWAQILKDAWRIYRDFFYDAGMHGVDWDAIGARYAAVLVDATSREDVHWLIGEMMAELNAGHAYNRPPPSMTSSGSARPVGLLGCDWEIENGAYRIGEILGGGAYDADARSPLARHGVDAAVGDYLLAVNGQPVDAARNVYSAFEGTAGKPTLLTLNTAPTMDGNEREVLVEPLESEVSLRYRSWVASNRDLVSELSDGRIGYLHVPSTGRDGQNELMRQFLGQQHKDALIIDERWNSGGQIPTRFIELLNRPVTNYWATRHGEDWTWPPVGHRGPKAMLINGAAGSGGDCFPYYFRQSGLGTLIGMRTWGGLIGISGNPSLIDGASPAVPTFGFYELDGTWGVEGHGVEPDIEVIDDPSEMQDGRDPQLLAAVEHLIGQLEGWSFDVGIRPASANRSGVGVTPEDR